MLQVPKLAGMLQAPKVAGGGKACGGAASRHERRKAPQKESFWWGRFAARKAGPMNFAARGRNLLASLRPRFARPKLAGKFSSRASRGRNLLSSSPAGVRANKTCSVLAEKLASMLSKFTASPCPDVGKPCEDSGTEKTTFPAGLLAPLLMLEGYRLQNLQKGSSEY